MKFLDFFGNTFQASRRLNFFKMAESHQRFKNKRKKINKIAEKNDLEAPE